MSSKMIVSVHVAIINLVVAEMLLILADLSSVLWLCPKRNDQKKKVNH